MYNVKGDLYSGNLQQVLYVVNKAKINISDSIVDSKGDITASNGKITMDTKEGSLWEGTSYMKNSGTTDFTMRETTWDMIDSSTLNNLTLLNNSTIYLNPSASNENFTPKVLTIVGDYAGNDSIIVFNTKLEDDSSLTEKLNVQGNKSGETKVQVRNTGGMKLF